MWARRGPNGTTFVVAVGLAIAAAACGSGASVTREDLTGIVRRDGIVFADDTIPDAVIDLLAQNQVVLIGETHHLREHWAFDAQLLQRLHEHGFRQFLVEQAHMHEWLLEDQYVNGATLVPDWVPPPFFERRYAALREFNATLPAGERIRLRTMDANIDVYGGAEGFRELLASLVDLLGPVDAVDEFGRTDYATPDSQVTAVEALRAALENDRATLTEAWGPRWYDRIVEMVEVERRSIDVRALEGDDSSRKREDVIKWVVDARLIEDPGGAVINIGAHHAQKAHLMGTEQEWMGDYLVNRSTAVTGGIIVIGATSARTVLERGAGGTPFDVRDTSPDDELYRVMAETYPDQTVFLPLDDPVFTDGGVAMNSEEVIYVTALKEQFDAVLQYGVAHRMPID